MIDHRETAHKLAIATLRNCPVGMAEQDKFVKICMALGFGFPDLPIEEILALSQAAITEEKEKH